MNVTKKLIAPFVMVIALSVAACTNQGAIAIDPLKGLAALELGTGDPVCSGVFITKDKVLSAKHCFADMFGDTPEQVSDTSGKTYPITDVWTSDDQDVAILTVKGYEGPTRVLACSVPTPGERVWAAGYPAVVSTTIVSALDVAGLDGVSPIPFGKDFIIATGSVNPGMSGGPWYNSDGDIVAVTSFEYNYDGEDTDLNGGSDLTKVKELCNGDS